MYKNCVLDAFVNLIHFRAHKWFLFFIHVFKTFFRKIWRSWTNLMYICHDINQELAIPTKNKDYTKTNKDYIFQPHHAFFPIVYILSI